jgi:hypothetical protein
VVVNRLRAVARSVKAGLSLAALAAVCVATTAGITAQDAVRNAATADSALLKTLTAEFTARRGADSGSGGILPTMAQANTDSAWAEAFLGRLPRADHPIRVAPARHRRSVCRTTAEERRGTCSTPSSRPNDPC